MLHPNRIPHNPPPLYLNLAYPSSTSFKIPVSYPQSFVRHVGPRGVQERGEGIARSGERDRRLESILPITGFVDVISMALLACLCY